MQRAYVVAACTYELGTLTLTARKDKLEVAEQNWVRRICRVKRNVGIKDERIDRGDWNERIFNEECIW